MLIFVQSAEDMFEVLLNRDYDHETPNSTFVRFYRQLLCEVDRWVPLYLMCVISELICVRENIV